MENIYKFSLNKYLILLRLRHVGIKSEKNFRSSHIRLEAARIYARVAREKLALNEMVRLILVIWTIFQKFQNQLKALLTILFAIEYITNKF